MNQEKMGREQRRPNSNRKSRKQKNSDYRTIWVSDVHLGTAGSQAAFLTAFLKAHECQRLYLVGDIIDGWRLKSSFYWPQEHSNVIRQILTKAKRGTKVIYVSGNHDEFLRRFLDQPLNLGNIEIVNEAVHKTADGKRLLVLHGDLFDGITRYHRWLALTGDVAYTFTLWANRRFNIYRMRFGMPYWSLSAYAKSKVKKAVSFIYEFEKAVARETKRRGMDGVVCGHIHQSEIRDIDGIRYYNCGDWVESCTALVERHDGRIEIVRWAHDGSEAVEPTSTRVVDFPKFAPERPAAA
nr:UDP-2,3-diacylglucosamine hydrolase [uncultured bacterium]